MLQFLPAAVYLTTISYIGFDLYFETETGMIMGIPMLCFLVLCILAPVIRSFAHGHTFPHIFLPPTDEKPSLNRAQLALAALCVLLPIAITHWMRPYVRVVTHMQCQMMEQDWKGMTETARENPELSYRHIAAYYAIALVQTGQQGSHLFDIRLDYDEPYMHGFNGSNSDIANYYILDCDYYAGLIQTSIHHSMEHMTMNGPTLRTLKLLTKCALLRGEWEVAEKYLRVLDKVPFEGQWVEKYQAMVRNNERIEADPEFKMVRLTEPIHDNFENFFNQPSFLGYYAALSEGRSVNALWNCLTVHLYTKTMPQFIFASQALRGTQPPQNMSEALLLMSSKYPDVMKLYPGLEYNRSRLMNFIQAVKPFIGSHDIRKEHAQELFPKWKGYYPYYYYFGNLKATRGHIKENEGSSNHGVN